jgi:hypothetical protein
MLFCTRSALPIKFKDFGTIVPNRICAARKSGLEKCEVQLGNAAMELAPELALELPM